MRQTNAGRAGERSLMLRLVSFLFTRPKPLDLAQELGRLEALQKRRDAMQASQIPYNEFEFR